jgi:hypothetical protein
VNNNGKIYKNIGGFCMFCPYEVVCLDGNYYIHEMSFVDFSSGSPIKRFGKRISDIAFRSETSAYNVMNNLAMNMRHLY